MQGRNLLFQRRIFRIDRSPIFLFIHAFKNYFLSFLSFFVARENHLRICFMFINACTYAC